MQRIFNEYSCEDQTDLTSVIYWCFAEYKEPILTKQEKAYLSAVIKPFRDKVIAIKKVKGVYTSEHESILIYVNGFDDFKDVIYLPGFEEGKMYQKMEDCKIYTLEELGL